MTSHNQLLDVDREALNIINSHSHLSSTHKNNSTPPHHIHKTNHQPDSFVRARRPLCMNNCLRNS